MEVAFVCFTLKYNLKLDHQDSRCFITKTSDLKKAVLT